MLLSTLRAIGLSLAVTAPSFAAGDCDQGEIPGSFPFRVDSGPRTPPAAGQAITIEIDNLPQPFYFYGSPFRAEASADLGLYSERFYARVNNGPWVPLSFDVEGDCTTPPGCTNQGPSLPIFYGTVFTGTLEIEILASPEVTAATCPNAWIRVYVQYAALKDDDCNGNRRADACDIADGILADCDGDGWADACQVARLPSSDCNGNGVPDCCDAQYGARDCNHNAVLDECEIAADSSLDCDNDGLLDACEIRWDIETDFNFNEIPDDCDLANGVLADCNENGVPDLAELASGNGDANQNAVLDSCEAPSPDLDPDGIVGAADLAILLARWGTSAANADLDRNGLVGASDLSLLLAAWGPVGICGDGLLSPNENCCNCPADAGCGAGFECYLGECLPCYYGSCPPPVDSCWVYYGGPLEPLCYGCSDPTYGTDTIPDCYHGFPLDNNSCLGGLFAPQPSHRFAMRLLDIGRHEVAAASVGIMLLLAIPSASIRSLRDRLRRRAQR